MPLAQGGKHVLIVDDNVNAAKTMGWIMELTFGHVTQMAHDGPSAIALAKTFEPVLIFLDIGLPGMNGYEVCQAMRKEPLLKDTKIVALTGWGQAEHLLRSKEAGFDRHLVKPVSIDEIKQLMVDLNIPTTPPSSELPEGNVA